MGYDQTRRVRVKICGITRAEDAVYASALGADAIGLNFYHASPRCIDIARAQVIVGALPPFVNAVGVFVDHDEKDIRAVLDKVPLDYLQFHGNEPAEACARYNLPYIKAISMKAGVDLAGAARQYAGAACLLLDTHVEGVAGGSGRQFDWGRVPAALAMPFLLAGGLTPANVRSAISVARPYGVDVSSGVESSPGIKDPDKLAVFIHEAIGA